MDDDVLTTLSILIIGEAAVGKSSLLLRFTEDNFDPGQDLTVGADFKRKRLTIDGNTVNLTIWDTSGLERFRQIALRYYRGAQGVILVYDVRHYDTFAQLELRLRELEIHSTKRNIIKMVVGNKIDVKNREVSKEEGLEFAERHQALFIEASAKTGDGVQCAFKELVRKIIQTPDLWKTCEDENENIEITYEDHPEKMGCSSYCNLA